jgi:1,4-dihydroxy-6-naphthoate synthase
MEEDVMRKHIDLYVNKYSLDVGIEGRAAIKKLLEVFKVKTDINVFVR